MSVEWRQYFSNNQLNTYLPMLALWVVTPWDLCKWISTFRRKILPPFSGLDVGHSDTEQCFRATQKIKTAVTEAVY